jgi:hypothetical protein
MADSEKTPATLLDELAALDPPLRRDVAKGLQKLAGQWCATGSR